MTRVEVGQVWLCNWTRGRIRVRVLAVEGDMVRTELVGSGRLQPIRRATLESGKRGARLVLNADGTAPSSHPTRQHVAHYRARLALAMRVQGKTPQAIAEQCGVRRSTVERWLVAARKKRAA